MKNQNRQFYLVDFQILSEAIKKTIQTKELLKEGEAETINEAVKKTGISRSAYYKYKDHVAPALDMQDDAIVSLAITTVDDIAVCSRILRKIAKRKNRVVTLNRGLPVKKQTLISLAFETAETRSDIKKLITNIENMKGVKDVRQIGGGEE